MTFGKVADTSMTSNLAVNASMHMLPKKGDNVSKQMGFLVSNLTFTKKLCTCTIIPK